MFFSERQQGLYKMFSRYVRPVWEGTVVEDLFVTEDGKKRAFVSVVVCRCFVLSFGIGFILQEFYLNSV